MKPTDKRIDALRDQLLTAQSQLTHDKSFALAIIVTGMPTAGRSEIVNHLLEWLDAKHIKVHALNELGARARMPALQRYWLTLPRRGEIAIYFLGWYEDYLAPALHAPKKAKRATARTFARITQLETMLHADRVRVLKLDLRVDRATQKERIAQLKAKKTTRWRVTPEVRWIAKHYARFRKATERMVEATDLPVARWHVVDGADPERRMIEAGSLVLKALQAGLHAQSRTPASVPAAKPAKLARLPFPSKGSELDDDTYERELEKLQGRLALATRRRGFAKHGVVLAFEGMDAAGKGGSIQRVTAALDARQYSVIPVSAPTPEELERPYLWRFWRNLPERGEFAIFDRSWYGRVLVERVRGFTRAADWRRAYDEINEFELQLTEASLIVQKFWLSISKAEQLRRLQDREVQRLKRFKVDQEDWENRRYFDAYQLAAKEMVERTSTNHAPWSVVAADNKKYARLTVLRTVCEAVERAIEN